MILMLGFAKLTARARFFSLMNNGRRGQDGGRKGANQFLPCLRYSCVLRLLRLIDSDLQVPKSGNAVQLPSNALQVIS
jgi:hypothetical protein